MSKWNIRTLCRMAILAALYVLLTLVSVRAGNLRITFASLPVVVCALLFGPWEAMGVAFMGEFLNQMLSYGFTATTAIWLIPPAIRGLVVGLAAASLRSREKSLDERPVLCYGVCMGAALATTLANTAAICADALIYHYFTPTLIYADLAVRIGTGLLTAAVGTTAAIPLTRVLWSAGQARRSV